MQQEHQKLQEKYQTMSVEHDKLKKKEAEFDMNAKEKMVQIHKVDTLESKKMKLESDV